MGTSRLESFSDGVFAVAITLLALGIGVPHTSGGASLAHALLRQWPQYAAYVVSFLTIGIIWINHHAMISRLRAVDHTGLVLNLVLLMTIGSLPFATDLVAHYLRLASGADLAAAVYAGCFLLMALVFSILNRHILFAGADLLEQPLPPARRRRVLAQAALGVVPYAVAVPLAFVSAYATLALCGAIAVYYALPVATGGAS